MKNRIYCMELDCFKNATGEELKSKRVSPCGCFNLEKIENDVLREEVRELILELGKTSSVTSIRTYITGFNLFVRFLYDALPDLVSIKDIKAEDMDSKAKKWLMINGMRNVKKRKNGKLYFGELRCFIMHLYKCHDETRKKFDYDSDIWYLDTLPFEVDMNLTNPGYTVNFSRIRQDKLKEQMKQIGYIHLKEKSLCVVRQEICAISRLSAFLYDRYPEVDGLEKIDRDIYEEYLVYLNVLCRDKKSSSGKLAHLRCVLYAAGDNLEIQSVKDLLCMGDRMIKTKTIYKVYSEAETERLNKAIIENCEEQVARLVIIHQLLGTRISEALTLEQNCVYYKNNKPWIRIVMHKVGNRVLEKPISSEVVKLIDTSIRYTKERYGDRRYIFVSSRNPEKPMRYTNIYNPLKSMIEKKDLRDDRGNRFTVSTHIWRHNYGKKLMELHLDDVVVARMLGHSGTGSLQNYRKIGNSVMAEETRAVRDKMDSMIAGVVGEWDDE